MSKDLSNEPLALLQEQVELLKQLVRLMGGGENGNKGEGIVTVPSIANRTTFVYIGGDYPGGCWGTSAENKEEEFKAYASNGQALHATVLGLETYTRTYALSKYKPQEKLVIYLEDNQKKYHLETGKKTLFSFSLVRCLLEIPSGQMNLPVYITPARSDSEGGDGIFAHVYDSNGKKIFAGEKRYSDWDAETDICTLQKRLVQVMGDRLIGKFGSLNPTADYLARKKSGGTASGSQKSTEGGTLSERDSINKAINLKVKSLEWSSGKAEEFIKANFPQEGHRKNMSVPQLMELDKLLVLALEDKWDK